MVGHGSCFQLKRGSGAPPPLLHVIFANTMTGYLEVKSVRQDSVKLADLHDHLGFAVPAPPEDKEKHEVALKRSIAINPHISADHLELRYWDRENDQCWDLDRDSKRR